MALRRSYTSLGQADELIQHAGCAEMDLLTSSSYLRAQSMNGVTFRRMSDGTKADYNIVAEHDERNAAELLGCRTPQTIPRLLLL